ncbi:EAL domain-containing protein [Rhodocyclus tenuis]|uniref:EAL domain-containing protein n=1 Tax=Rhodocyclus gracilis TaxID=2929842 RepID=A0ABX0WEK9_9RHOO|nr:EAL domain-containing protein [Rhodocyclus gracilis]NJA88167.1 EAL domain-containing protein [Rhodocyclus gracilis]
MRRPSPEQLAPPPDAPAASATDPPLRLNPAPEPARTPVHGLALSPAADLDESGAATWLRDATIDSLPCPVFLLDDDGRLRAWNDLFQALCAATGEALLGRSFAEFIGTDALAAMLAALADPAAEAARRHSGRFLSPYAPARPHEFSLRRDPTRPATLIGTLSDSSARHAAEAHVEKLQRTLRLLSDCNTTLLHADTELVLLDEICQLIVDRGGYRMAWAGFAAADANKTVCPVSFAGHNDGFLQSIEVVWSDSALGDGPTGKAIRTGRLQIMENIADVPPSSHWRDAALERGYVAGIAIPLRSDGEVFGSLGIYSGEADAFGEEEIALLSDLAKNLAFGIQNLRSRRRRDEAEKRLEHLAHHDPLTNLPNRLQLRKFYENAAATSARARRSMALLYISLEGFKEINDSLGHDIGDRLLMAVVERLKKRLPEGDFLSRHGGKEFIALCQDTANKAVIETRVADLLRAGADPVVLGGHTLYLSFGIGISRYPEDGTSLDILLRKADAALGHVQGNGGGGSRFYESRMSVDAMARLQLQGSLRKALANREFVLHYQPQINIASGEIVGVEALVRWQKANGELVPPNSFIPVAEDSGLILPLGEWVMEEACRQARVWDERGLPPLTVAVNLSALQFRHGNILDCVARTLDESGLPPHRLELELTESILLHDTDMVLQTINGLHQLGVKLSIDDFGTGYSSLAYLNRFRVDKLKIDQSFVRSLGGDADDSAIVRAIIQLGRTLKLSVIAEGVETDRQLAYLGSFGCHEAQGYLFSRPLPAAELTRQLTAKLATHDGADFIRWEPC